MRTVLEAARIQEMDREYEKQRLQLNKKFETKKAASHLRKIPRLMDVAAQAIYKNIMREPKAPLILLSGVGHNGEDGRLVFQKIKNHLFAQWKSEGLSSGSLDYYSTKKDSVDIRLSWFKKTSSEFSKEQSFSEFDHSVFLAHMEIMNMSTHVPLVPLLINLVEKIRVAGKESSGHQNLASIYLVDAVFGIGFRSPLSGSLAELFRFINHNKKDLAFRVFSIDVPSGLRASDIQISSNRPSRATEALGLDPLGARDFSSVLQSDVCFSLGFLKPCHVFMPWLCGKIKNLSLPYRNFSKEKWSKFFLYTNRDAQIDYQHFARLSRPNDSKVSRGKLLVVAGSDAMPGAAELVSGAALRMGVGYVYLLKLSEFKTPFPDLIEIRQEHLESILSQLSAVVIGPGLGRTPEVLGEIKNLLEWLKSKKFPAVLIDADALNVLGDFRPLASWIITPHIGEADKLFKKALNYIEQQKFNHSGRKDFFAFRPELKVSRDFAISQGADFYQYLNQSEELANGMCLLRDFVGCHVLLKGPRSVLANGSDVSKKAFLVNSTGSSVLARAGSGDVLAGIVGGLLARGLSPFRALRLGVYIHGAIGEEYELEAGNDFALLASEFRHYLEKVIQKRLRVHTKGAI